MRKSPLREVEDRDDAGKYDVDSDDVSTAEKQSIEQSEIPPTEQQRPTTLSAWTRATSCIVTAISVLSLIAVIFIALFSKPPWDRIEACVSSADWYFVGDYFMGELARTCHIKTGLTVLVALITSLVYVPINLILANTLHHHISDDEANWQRVGLHALWILLGSGLAFWLSNLRAGNGQFCFLESVKQGIAEKYPERFRELYGLADGIWPGAR